VNTTEDTDQGADSPGCGMAFISWMISQGHGLSQMAPAMVSLGDSGTLAQLYANLTSDDPANAWPNFQDAINSLPSGVNSDDPFNGLSQPTQKVNVAPGSAELVGRVFASMVTDLVAGRKPERIAANIRTVLAPAAPPSASAMCAPGSKRLLPPGKGERRSKSA